MNAPTVRDLGQSDWPSTHRQMLALHERVRTGESGGEVWLVEHEPIYTAGRATSSADLFADVIPIERGGRITYHGPGQLVVYPILQLEPRDVRAWLRRLEQFGIAVCRQFDLDASASLDGTGVFVGTHKVASIGVAIRNWVSLHGIAINIDMDLEPFFRIRPCGLAPEVMSDLSRQAGRTITMAQAKQACIDSMTTLSAQTS